MSWTWTLALALSAPPATTPPKAPANDVFALVFRTGPAWDASKAPTDQPFFADHSRNLRDLRAEGRVLLGGRLSDQGLVLVRAASAQEARALADRDPSVKHGTFQVEVHPFYPFMPGCVGADAPQ
jgi:uncharacterized protein YciI